MPSRERHINQARRNEAFAFHLLDAPWSVECNDWAVNALFYAALHLVDAYLASLSFHPDTHEVRNGYVARLTSLQPVQLRYRRLRFRSEDARYQCRLFPFTARQVESLRTNDYEPLKRHIEALLGENDGSAS